jgi:hypothetical protein
MSTAIEKKDINKNKNMKRNVLVYIIKINFLQKYMKNAYNYSQTNKNL